MYPNDLFYGGFANPLMGQLTEQQKQELMSRAMMTGGAQMLMGAGQGMTTAQGLGAGALGMMNSTDQMMREGLNQQYRNQQMTNLQKRAELMDYGLQQRERSAELAAKIRQTGSAASTALKGEGPQQVPLQYELAAQSALQGKPSMAAQTLMGGKQNAPYTDYGKINADFMAGRITKPQYETALENVYKSQENKPSALTEKVNMLISAGADRITAIKIATGAMDEVDDGRGNTAVIDKITNQPIGILETRGGKIRWIPMGGGKDPLGLR